MRNIRMGRFGRATAGLVIVAAGFAVAGAPVQGQVPPTPPAVSMGDAETSIAVYRDCDGTEIGVFTFGYVTVQRTVGPGVDDSEMEVPITYGGSLEPLITYRDDLAYFEEGSDITEIAFDLSDVASGDLTITVAPPGAGDPYVEGEPSTLTVELPAAGSEDVLDCRAPLDIDEDEAEQSIDVGERPDSLEVFGDFLGDGDILDEMRDLFSTPVVGVLPPGLTYEDDTWGGAATTPGVYSFQVRLCADSSTTIGGDGPTTVAVPDELRSPAPGSRAWEDLPATLCYGTAEVEIEVEAAAVVVPVAGAATPIRSSARFTG